MGQQEGKPGEVIRRPWREVPEDGGYYPFDSGQERDGKSKKVVNWTRLFVEAKPLPSPTTFSLLEKGATVGDLTCAICLGDMGAYQGIHKTRCHHLFHQSCVSLWLQRGGTCPLCRSDV